MSRRIRLALIRPPVPVLHKFSKPVECLALGYVAAAARASGHEVVMLDGMLYDWTNDEAARRILDTRADVVAFTNVLNHWPESLSDLVRLVREGGFGGPILVGGHAVSFFPERALAACPELDGVVVGEGETSIVDVLDAIASGSDWSEARGLCFRRGDSFAKNPTTRNRDLDALPYPARDLGPEIIRQDGLLAISTSRGCYARCSFCSIPRFYGLESGRELSSGSWLARSVESVVAELQELHAQTEMLELLIVDDEFFGGCDVGIARAKSLAGALRDLSLPVGLALSCRAENVDTPTFELLKEGGLRHVFIGLESGLAQDLKLYGKRHTVDQNRFAVERVKRLDLSFQPGFMMFNPRTTLRELRENLDFLEEIGECKPMTINSGVDPHFGTPLLYAMERDGVLQDRGTLLESGYLDHRVATARKVAGRMMDAFQPLGDLIAGLRSAITFEWRREVPGRTKETEELLDVFEALVSRELTGVFRGAVDSLEDSGSPGEAEGLLDDVSRALADAAKRIEVPTALVLSHLESAEGSVRYWSQEDLIARRREAQDETQ